MQVRPPIEPIPRQRLGQRNAVRRSSRIGAFMVRAVAILAAIVLLAGVSQNQPGRCPTCTARTPRSTPAVATGRGVRSTRASIAAGAVEVPPVADGDGEAEPGLLGAEDVDGTALGLAAGPLGELLAPAAAA